MNWASTLILARVVGALAVISAVFFLSFLTRFSRARARAFPLESRRHRKHASIYVVTRSTRRSTYAVVLEFHPRSSPWLAPGLHRRQFEPRHHSPCHPHGP